MFRRLVFIILMLILPFQQSWAAAGAYCQHEQGAAAQHFGHHAHQHPAADKDNNKKPGVPLATYHADCVSCHLTGAGIVDSSLDVPAPVSTSPAVSPEVNFLSSVILRGPERPKWAAAV